MKLISLLFLLALFASSSALATNEPATIIPKVDYVTITNPTLEQAATDAHRAIKAKDYRFMMASGFTTYCPGITIDARAFSLIQKNGVKGMVGTSDTFQNDAEKQLNDRLVRYAEIYNKLILSAYKKETE